MLLALLAVDDGEAAEVVNPILPAVNEIFWGAITFAVLFLLVRFVFLPSAKRAMNDRAATIRADLDAAEAARAQAVSASAEAQDQLADVRAEAASIIEAARSEAMAERERLIGRAEREVAAMKEIAESEVERERSEAMASVQSQVSDLAVGAASKVVNRQISLSDAQPVIDRFLNNPN
ncbi:MAG: F0F1 ATP synthase subunit B [Actinomycetota bacterium]